MNVRISENRDKANANIRPEPTKIRLSRFATFAAIKHPPASIRFPYFASWKARLEFFKSTSWFRSSISFVLSSADICLEKLRMIRPPAINKSTLIKTQSVHFLPNWSDWVLIHTNLSRLGPEIIQIENFCDYKSSRLSSSNALFSFKQHKSSIVTPNVSAIR